MSDRTILLQQVIYQRNNPPAGFRIWSDGTFERPAADNPLPDPTERLDRDRDLCWESAFHLSAGQLEALRETIRASGFLTLPSALLINYCKEDPPVAIWVASLDGQTVRVVLWDPRPRRSAEIDRLNTFVAEQIK